MTSGSPTRRAPRGVPSHKDDVGSGMPLDEMALVRRVLRRDAWAQGAMVELLVPHLRVVANAILSNRADADEAVQLALMRVLKGLPTFRGESSLVRWARRVATNVCLRAREQDQRRLRVIETRAEPEDGQLPASPSSTERFGAHSEISHYLGRLPDRTSERRSCCDTCWSTALPRSLHWWVRRLTP